MRNNCGLFLYTIGIFRVISCASLSTSSPSSSSSSSLLLIKGRGLPTSPHNLPTTRNEDPLGDAAINSINSGLIARSSPANGDSVNSGDSGKPVDPLGDYAIRSSLGLRSSPTSSPSSSSSSLSPSKLIPSFFSSATSRVTSFPVSQIAMRPINRLLDLFPRYDYDDSSLMGRDSFSGKRIHGRQQQQQHHPHISEDNQVDHQGNSLTSSSFNSNDPLPDLMKQGAIPKAPWLAYTFRGPPAPTRRSAIKSIVDRIFG